MSRSRKKKTFAQVVSEDPKSSSVFSRLHLPKDYVPMGASAVHLDHASSSNSKSKSVFNRLSFSDDYFSSNFGEFLVDQHSRHVLRWRPKRACDHRDLPKFKPKDWSAPALGPCSRCLSTTHGTNNCLSEIRCRRCFGYGHLARNCWAKRFPTQAMRGSQRHGGG